MTVVADNPTFVDFQQKMEEKYSAPMPWVGVYVAAASLVCTLAMVADIFHGFLHKKLWFPCKFFTLNAASLTVIAIAMKLPVDLNNPMPHPVDQTTKMSSSAFMCIMMANFMPSLGSMKSSELLLNIVALDILVITIIVNVSIQLSTGLIDGYAIHLIFMFFMLYLLSLITSSALMIPISKKILRYKYNQKLKKPFTEESDPTRSLSTVEKLTSDVSKYWIMAETSNPQFVMACSPTCSASGAISGAICFLVVFFSLQGNLPYSDFDIRFQTLLEGESDYKWSVFPIIIVQFIGVLVGTIAPIFRLFRAIIFKLPFIPSKKYQKVWQIEKYWIQTLVDWKSSYVSLDIGGRKCQKFIHEFKNLSLNLMIGIQIFIVIMSKITRLTTIFLVLNAIHVARYVAILNYFFAFEIAKLVERLVATNCFSRSPRGLESEQHDSAMSNLKCFVLQLEDEEELANETVTRISKAAHLMIEEAKKKHPSNLMTLLDKSRGFVGVAKFDNSQVTPPHSSKHPNSWSLVVATLTSIAIALQTRKDDTGDCLLRGVKEGLQFVRLIEESLDPNEDTLVNVRRAASYVWLQVEIYNKWMDEDLQEMALRGKTSVEILNLLGDKAKRIIEEYNNIEQIAPTDSYFPKFVAANSMYRISKSILLDHEGTEGQNNEKLFTDLFVMIADQCLPIKHSTCD